MSGILCRRRHELRDPRLQHRRILVAERELILRGADIGVDRQILNRLHEQGDAGHPRRLLLQAPDDLAGSQLAFAMRLEIDEESPEIERDVGAVDADEGGEADDVLVLQDRVGELLLALRHGGERCDLRGLGDALDDAGVLDREEPLGDDDIEVAGQDEGPQGDDEREHLVVEHDAQRAAIEAHQSLEEAPAARFRRLMSALAPDVRLQQFRA